METIAILLQKYMQNTASQEEKARLAKLVDQADNNTIVALLKESWESADDTIPVFTAEETANALAGILNKKPGWAPVIPIVKRAWFRIAAAAVLITGLVVVYNLITTNNKDDHANGVVIKPDHKHDIAPGGNKAVLTLADGLTIILDSVANGKLASQGNTSVMKREGQLAYTSSGNAGLVLYNTISTPRGGQYQLVLADGTKVWLNAASSLRYPTAFTGSERKVELTGEGYFEVAKSVSSSGAKQSFKVNVAGKGEVEVLGTHFNVNSYNDEASINTTLIEGSIKVTSLITHNSLLIKPGEQAQINQSGQISTNKNVDTDQVIAWKNEQFNFSSSDIQFIMRQIGRWYDVDVIFKGYKSKETFTGIVSRKSNISQVLKIMEESGVKFKIEARPDDPVGRGKRIIVME